MGRETARKDKHRMREVGSRGPRRTRSWDRLGGGASRWVREGEGEAVDGCQGSGSGEGKREKRQDSGAEAGDSGAEDRGKRQREEEKQ